ncbi:hypothetical protein [Brevundimonas sp. KM4]|uniref:hypothetical protein n=1 Tax=Brevundimonas sp. KM4 TaxID=1628191 RepID=UPI0005F85A82|nr:hypothetical protein [Brevundimonas sp. KM4]KJV41509.1 hypothetical protein VH88_08635 [Brevundimonas sp. KM4]
MTDVQPDRANANPSKSFFIAMLTRDIDLVDCILDLLDNSVDGIGQVARREGRNHIQARAALEASGWRVLTIWQCETASVSELVDRLRGFLGPPRSIAANSSL